jgi:hypothetical protein
MASAVQLVAATNRSLGDSQPGTAACVCRQGSDYAPLPYQAEQIRSLGSESAGCLGPVAAGLPERRSINDQVAIPPWIVRNGELEHAVEEEPAAAGSAAVEAKYELVEIALQVCLVDGALVGAEKPALSQRGDPVDPRK